MDYERITLFEFFKIYTTTFISWVNTSFQKYKTDAISSIAQKNPKTFIFRIVVTVSLLAQELGCYKMSLDCKDKLIKFYETLGYKMEAGNSNAMNMR